MSLELKVNKVKGVETSIVLTWRLDEDTTKEIIDNEDIVEAFLLLTVVRKPDDDFQEIYSSRQRQVVRLTDPMTYVRFYQPGEHIILATIVWEAKHNGRHPKSIAQGSIYGGYQGSILLSHLPTISQAENDAHNIFLGLEFPHQEFAFLTIDVDEKHFAKESSERLKIWVNMYYEADPRNECQFWSNRFILAFTLKPFYFLFLKLIRLAVGVLAVIVWFLFGYREFRPLMALNIFTDLEDAFLADYGDGLQNSIFWCGPRDENHELGNVRPSFLWPLTPIVPILALCILAAVAWKFDSVSLTIWQQASYVTGGVFISSVAFAIVGAAMVFFPAFFSFFKAKLLGTMNSEKHKSWRDRKWKRKVARGEARIRRRKEKRQATALVERKKLQGLSREFTTETISYAALPKDQRTFRLMYLGAKTRCKSFIVR